MFRSTVIRTTPVWIPLLRDTNTPWMKPSHFAYIHVMWLSISDTKGKVKKGEESVRNPNVRNSLIKVSDMMKKQKEDIDIKAKSHPTGPPILTKNNIPDLIKEIYQKSKLKWKGRSV